MGFYGNITNTARTQFQFDKKYASRYELEQNCSKDGVYTGRYVLVEYDQDRSIDLYPSGFFRIGDVLYRSVERNTDGYIIPSDREDIIQSVITQPDVIDSVKGTTYSNKIYRIESGCHIYNQNNSEIYIQVREVNGANYITNFDIVTSSEFASFWGSPDTTVLDRQIFRINGELKVPSAASSYVMPNVVFVIPIGYAYSTNEGTEYVSPLTGSGSTTVVSYVNQETEEVESIYDVALWKTIAEISENSADVNVRQNFLINFQTDVAIYGTARGYDSTVWQKVYSGGIEKYVMVAELNTVVPTFDVTADAPSVVPIMPHFDTDSTNVYYKLHWQPQWGFRIKAAKPTLTGPTISTTGQVGGGSPNLLSQDTIYYPSDEQTRWTSDIYDKNAKVFTSYTYNPILQTWQPEPEYADMDAAIYYNKKGFNPEEISYSSDLLLQQDANGHLLDGTISAYSASGWTNEDKITIAASGLSGNEYHYHKMAGTVDYQPQIDTQEFSVMLPSIGDSLAQFWDLIYGGRDTSEIIRSTNRRNLDIAWEDGGNALARQGLRLTNLKPSGNGFTLDVNQVNTLAGIINTSHDLLGMIIVDTENGLTGADLESAPSNYIYYNATEGSYNRKSYEYTYDEIQYGYSEIELTEDEYETNVYYIEDDGEYVVADEAFNNEETYYKKVYGENVTRWFPVTLYPFTNGYYIRTAKGEWMHDANKQPLENVRYYEFVSGVRATLSGKYDANKYYYPVEGGTDVYDASGTDFILSTDKTATEGRAYYELTPSIKPVNINMRDRDLYDSETGTYGQVNDGEDPNYLTYIYEPDRFYYEGHLDPNDETSATVLFVEKMSHAAWKAKYDAHDPEVTEREYLALDKTISKETTTIMIQDENGNIVPATVINNVVNVSGKYKVKLIPFEENKYYYRQNITEIPNPNYASIDDPMTITTVGEWRLLTPQILTTQYDMQFIEDPNGNQSTYFDYYTLTKSLQGNFYISNLYWYKTPDLNWVKDRNPKITEGREYYQSLTFNAVNKKFYMPHKYYYQLDENNYNIDRSNSMTVGRQYYERHPLYVMEDTYNLYPRGSEWLGENGDMIPASVRLAYRSEGMILTPLAGFARDLNTVNGLILRMNQMLEIDNYDTRDKRTLQGSINVINDYINKFSSLTPREMLIVDNYGRIHSTPWTCDNWLRVNINANPQHPELTFEHLYNPVANTTSAIAEADRGDTITLYTPILDDKGHVVGHDDKTVTLPFTFKILKSENSSDDGNKWSQTAGATHSTGENVTDIVADTTKDTLTFAGGNKWIRLQSDSANDKLTLAHETHDIVTTALTTDFNAVGASTTFTVQDLTFDIAGHVTGNQPHTYTLPYNYKTFTLTNSSDVVTGVNGTDGNVIAADPFDTLNLNADNKWIKLVADNTNTSIGISHEIHTITTTAKPNTDLETVSSFTVQDLTFDEAGHVTANQAHTYTLQNSFKTFNITGSSNSTNAITANTVDLVADSTADSLALKAGNRWIELQGDATTDQLLIGHAAAGTASTSKGDTTAQTPDFGATFKVLSAGIDQMGHVASLEEHTVTIPKPSMTAVAASDDTVLNSASLTDTTGAFSFGTKKVGSLKLTDYTSTSNLLVATDTINGAFKKVAEHIDTVDSAIGTLTNLPTTEKSSLVGAINEIDSAIGTLSNLTTTAQTDLVSAINEVDSHADTNAANISGNGDAYDPTKAYKVGDYCIYENQLYKCTTACTAGNWTTNSSNFITDTLVNIINTINGNQHLTVDYTSATNEMTIYLDGVSVGSITLTQI